jgi:hypothetical protein
MRKFFLGVATSIFLLGLCGFQTIQVHAAGGSTPLEFTASSSSATADGSTKITFTVYAYFLTCPNNNFNPDGTCAYGAPYGKQGNSGVLYSIYTTSTGNAFGGTTIGGADSRPSVTTDSDGKATFTVASSTTGTKTFTIYYGGTSKPDPSADKDNPSVTVTFKAPVAKTTPKTTTVAEPTPPEAPKASSVEIAGKAADPTKTFIVVADKLLTLKGTTVASGSVKLYIFSTPTEATVTADTQGNWTYDIKNLEPGSHHVEAEVTDPITKKTSARATLATFTVAKSAAGSKTIASAKSSLYSLPLIIGGAAILILAIAGVWWLRRRSSRSNKPSDILTPPPSESPTTSTPQNPQV